ncbi:transcription factor, putative [Pseudozyma hubeiensis SY62]|uniref:Transcription factor, putative n=1 Tax=Pseudozyma hubeiensis (strain SY62) TaxID=1305764 RepID=R9P1K8_PSEHS|nr:transcription factor, putative [Pseudozyma hubeiensis SY62]GAC95126.1 transcription factor, putative [Pseudozyma hubeiensis SY62]
MFRRSTSPFVCSSHRAFRHVVSANVGTLEGMDRALSMEAEACRTSNANRKSFNDLQCLRAVAPYAVQYLCLAVQITLVCARLVERARPFVRREEQRFLLPASSAASFPLPLLCQQSASVAPASSPYSTHSPLILGPQHRPSFCYSSLLFSTFSSPPLSTPTPNLTPLRSCL